MSSELGRFSQESLDSLLNKLESQYSQVTPEDAKDLFSFINTLENNPNILASLTDASYSETSRQKLAQKLVEGKVTDRVSHVIQDLAGSRWTHPEDFVHSAEIVAVNFALAAQENYVEASELEEIEKTHNDVLAFSALLEKMPDVEQAVANPIASFEAKNALVSKLMTTDDEITQMLIKQAMLHSKGQRPPQALKRYNDYISNRSNRWVAKVYTAHPLSQNQQERLQKGLSKMYDRNLKLDVFEDPDLVGGIKVQVGNDVFDGSVTGKLSELNQNMSSIT